MCGEVRQLELKENVKHNVCSKCFFFFLFPVVVTMDMYESVIYIYICVSVCIWLT